jgi:8-oxo-dGTP diphosphatase
MLIRASGGLVFRPAGDDDFEILVVHRPKYDDWSLPKGKDDPGETAEQAAIREVEEETGIRCRLVAPLAESRYTLPSGDEKLVTYFAMKPFAEVPWDPNDEVDEVRWVAVADAPGMLTYERDRNLVASAGLRSLADTSMVMVVRHAAAGSRSKWEDDDALRPLTDKGWAQARRLVDMLTPYGVDRVLSSRYVRCRQTVEPLAEAAGLEVEDHPALAEGADWIESLRLLESTDGLNVVFSSHGDIIPALMDGLLRRGVPLEWSDAPGMLPHRKGSTWMVERTSEAITIARYVPPPEL